MVSAHRHKETFSWTIAAFYALATVQLAGATSGNYGTLARAGVAVAFALASVILLTFTRRQFNLRNYYVRMSGVVELLLTECLAGQLDDMPPMNRRASVPRRSSRPTKIIALVRFFFPPRLPLDHFGDLLPAFVINRALSQPYPGDRRIQEWPYTLMFVVFVAGLVAILVRS